MVEKNGYGNVKSVKNIFHTYNLNIINKKRINIFMRFCGNPNMMVLFQPKIIGYYIPFLSVNSFLCAAKVIKPPLPSTLWLPPPVAFTKY